MGGIGDAAAHGHLFSAFTLLEDLGYLPRVAFNLDKHFSKCRACGKQALTMCMGFGCNAAGIVGCRIIDSPRERLIAILTNNFVPCNGRFPTFTKRAKKEKMGLCTAKALFKIVYFLFMANKKKKMGRIAAKRESVLAIWGDFAENEKVYFLNLDRLFV